MSLTCDFSRQWTACRATACHALRHHDFTQFIQPACSHLSSWALGAAKRSAQAAETGSQQWHVACSAGVARVHNLYLSTYLPTYLIYLSIFISIYLSLSLYIYIYIYTHYYYVYIYIYMLYSSTPIHIYLSL